MQFTITNSSMSRVNTTFPRKNTKSSILPIVKYVIELELIANHYLFFIRRKSLKYVP